MKEPPRDPPSPSNTDETEPEFGNDQSTHSLELSPLDGRLEGWARMADSDMVAGVDRSVLEDFLGMLRDYYPQVDKATWFLELTTGQVNVSGIKNVKGILSHLVMLLEQNSPLEKRKEQLVNAEGHLRRAITEPYEIALDGLTLEFADTYERFKKEVLPISDQHGSLRQAPSAAIVNVRLEEIGDLGSKGREAKDKSLKDPEWESGVSSLIAAFEKLNNLKSELEGYCNAYDSMLEDEARQEKLRTEIQRESKKSTRLHFLAIAIGIAGIIIAVLLVVIPGLADGIRNFFSVR
jgi:hypothetical protein